MAPITDRDLKTAVGFYNVRFQIFKAYITVQHRQQMIYPDMAFIVKFFFGQGGVDIREVSLNRQVIAAVGTGRDRRRTPAGNGGCQRLSCPAIEPRTIRRQ